MSLRYLAGFITASYNPLKVPNAPTISSVTAGNTQLTVAFTAPSNVGGGAITSYIAIAKTTAGVITTATGSSSPITITGLTNSVAYNVQVAAVNAYGPSAYSAPTSGTPVPSYYIYTWGSNSFGALGLSDVVNRSSPVQVGASNPWSSYVAMSGSYSTFAVTQAGTLWSWGYNGNGELGQNDVTNRSSPVQIGALTNWLSVSASAISVAAIKTNGTLWVWGSNIYGQLGNNDSAPMSSPIQLGALTSWASTSSGPFNVIATKTDGTLWGWGRNNWGQLGQNNVINYSSPVQIGSDTNWASAFSGSYFTIAIKTTGTIWGWGLNSDGELGQGNTILRSSPVQIGALTTWSKSGSSSSSTCAIKTDGTLWAWGKNNNGQLGQNNRVYKSSPVQVGALTTWSKIGANNASDFFMVIKTDGTLWSWGLNTDGNLGQNDRVNRSSPVQVGALTTWNSVSTGSGNTIATSS